MIFNVSIDDIEQTETDLLSETFENEINIGNSLMKMTGNFSDKMNYYRLMNPVI